ncbi:MAG TPA: alpha/beta hydrolase [Rhizomicrobium sp.]|jgi:lysophospholipase|nr:alpha/beta hydrolase [Rhizomicrobium sp.]
MIPAAESFAPFFLTAGAVKLRAARFEAEAAKGVCLFLNGQTEFIEKYFEVIDEWRGRGFSLVTFDWRGQGGSDRLLPDPRKAHINDFAAYDRDLDAVIRDVVQPMMAEGEYKTKPIALAHSMGGNILLRRLHGVQDEFAAAILSAPMLGIRPRGVPWWLVERIAAAINRNGPSTDFVWGMARRDQLNLPFALQIVTSDPKRYARSQAILKAHPDLRLNGPTWGWLDAALRAIALTREPGYAEAIKTSALLIAAGRDRVCDSAATHAFAMRMRDAEFVEIENAQHEIMMERDPLRAQWWSAVDDFLKKNAPAVSR